MTVDGSRLDDLRIDRVSRDSKRGRWKWIALAILAGIAAAAAAWWKLPRIPMVEVATARKVAAGTSTTVLNASGYVTARREAVVSSKVTGKVTDVRVEEGMEVHEGEILARLDDKTARASLRLAEARAEAARKALGETRVQIRKADLDFVRMRDLTAEQVASQSDYDQAKTSVDAMNARLVTQQEDLNVAEKEVALQRRNVADTEIRAPFKGIVVTKDAQPGEMISPVSAGGGFTRTGICTIVDMSSLEIEVDVNEAYITRVRPGQSVEAVLDAYPSWTIPSHVITIIPTADREKATVRVRIAFDHPDPRILPDMGVKVSFIGSRDENAVTSPTVSVPRAAIHHDGDEDVVFVVIDGRLERRAVKVASTDSGGVEVSSGLEAGESVVIAAPGELEDGLKVHIGDKGEA